MSVPVTTPVVPTDKLRNMVAWYRLDISTTVNLAQMKHVLSTTSKQEHCISPLQHYCDVRSQYIPRLLVRYVQSHCL